MTKLIWSQEPQRMYWPGVDHPVTLTQEGVIPMSDVRDPDRDQVAPVPNDNPSCHDLVIADLLERKEHGLRKYGSLLQAGNGRDFDLDVYEELLDATAYMRGKLEEKKQEGVHLDLIHHNKVTMVVSFDAPKIGDSIRQYDEVVESLGYIIRDQCKDVSGLDVKSLKGELSDIVLTVIDGLPQ